MLALIPAAKGRVGCRDQAVFYRYTLTISPPCRLWHMRDLAPVQAVQNGSAWVNDVAYLEGPRKLLMASSDRSVGAGCWVLGWARWHRMASCWGGC